MEHSFGYHIPVKMREELGYLVKGVSDRMHKELHPDEIFALFKKEYVNRFEPLDITNASFTSEQDSVSKESGAKCTINATINGVEYILDGEGNGRLDAVSNALKATPYVFDYHFVTYSEHALESDSDSTAVAYVAIADGQDNIYWGVGTHKDIVAASINALVSAINRENVVSKHM